MTPELPPTPESLRQSASAFRRDASALVGKQQTNARRNLLECAARGCEAEADLLEGASDLTLQALVIEGANALDELCSEIEIPDEEVLHTDEIALPERRSMKRRHGAA